VSTISSSRSIYNTNRLVLGDRTTGVTGSILGTVQKWRYHDFVSIISGAYVKGNNRFAFCSNSDIIYFDSAMPNMAQVADKSRDFASFTLPGLSYIGNNDLDATAINNPVDIYVSASSPWPVSFPFQSKYKQIGRQISQNRQLGYATGTNGGTLIGSLNFLSIASATLPTWYYSIWCELTSSNTNVVTDFAKTNISASILAALPGGTIPLKFDLMKKVFFGSGDGMNLTISASAFQLPNFRTMPKFDVYLFLSQSNSNSVYVLLNPQFRGFKYGVLNPNATNPKYVFKRNHFGQMRDLLETPFFSATITSDNRTLEYPVSVTFLSGTQVYASASLDLIATGSTTFNPRDNGQYDIHSRAGQPYFDIDAVD
jgi:hypothetical protein